MKKIKITKKLLKQLKLFIPAYQLAEANYSLEIAHLEESLAELTGIEDIEFIFADGDLVGIGNASRTMRLIHTEEIENEK